MHNKKMIVLDLDGTLLTTNLEILEETKKYINKLKEQGHLIVIATGRLEYGARELIKGKIFPDYIISSTGAAIYDENKSKVIKESTIDNIEAEKVYKEVKQSDEITRIYFVERKQENIYTTRKKEEYKFHKVIPNVEDFLFEPNKFTHIVIRYIKGAIDKIDIGKLQQKMPDINIMIMYDTQYGKTQIELFKKGVNKYEAISYVANIEKIDNSNIIAFGDSSNDIEMIENAGVGVAMGNAIPELKKIAKHITLTNNENGIKDFLEKYLK